MTLNEKHFNEVAQAAAAYAHLAFFSSRRGILPSDEALTVIYDNNPPKGQRTHTLNAAARLLELQGHKKLAEASFPVGGEDDGYTLVVVFDKDAGDHAAELFQACILKEMEEGK